MLRKKPPCTLTKQLNASFSRFRVHVAQECSNKGIKHYSDTMPTYTSAQR